MVLDTDNPNVLQSVKNTLRENGNADFWEAIMLEKKTQILEGIKKVETVAYEDLMKRHRT